MFLSIVIGILGFECKKKNVMKCLHCCSLSSRFSHTTAEEKGAQGLCHSFKLAPNKGRVGAQWRQYYILQELITQYEIIHS